LSPRKRWTDDSALIRACRKGDGSAWETLIGRYRRLIFSVPVAYRFPPDDAEEIFQRVAVKLFEHLDRLRKAEGLASWLVVTTRRECHAFRRRARRWDPIEEADPATLAEEPEDVVKALDAVQSEHTLTLAFERMDETCRSLLAALYVEDPTPSYVDIGKRLGRSVGSLGPTRARCLKKLQKLFLDLGGERP